MNAEVRLVTKTASSVSARDGARWALSSWGGGGTNSLTVLTMLMTFVSEHYRKQLWDHTGRHQGAPPSSAASSSWRTVMFRGAGGKACFEAGGNRIVNCACELLEECHPFLGQMCCRVKGKG